MAGTVAELDILYSPIGRRTGFISAGTTLVLRWYYAGTTLVLRWYYAGTKAGNSMLSAD